MDVTLELERSAVEQAKGSALIRDTLVLAVEASETQERLERWLATARRGQPAAQQLLREREGLVGDRGERQEPAHEDEEPEEHERAAELTERDVVPLALR